MRREHGGKRSYHSAEVIDFSSNVNCFGPPTAVRELFSGGLAAEIADYPDPDYPELKAALADYTGRRPGEVFLGNGSAEVFFWASSLLKPSKALIVAPTFSEYGFAVRGAGGEVIEHVLDMDSGFSLDVEDTAGSAADCDLAFVCNPNNPTGNLFEPGAIQNLASSMKPGGVLVVDEAFMDFCEDRASHSMSGGRAEEVWVSGSLTKFFSLAGLRIGYLLAPPVAVRKMEAAAPLWRINRPAEMAAKAALGDSEFIRETPGRIAREREHLLELLQGTGFLEAYPSAANFVLARIGGLDLDSAALKGLLLERGFLIRDASDFSGLDGSFIRVAVRNREENEALAEALRSIRAERSPA